MAKVAHKGHTQRRGRTPEPPSKTSTEASRPEGRLPAWLKRQRVTRPAPGACVRASTCACPWSVCHACLCVHLCVFRSAQNHVPPLLGSPLAGAPCPRQHRESTCGADRGRARWGQGGDVTGRPHASAAALGARTQENKGVRPAVGTRGTGPPALLPGRAARGVTEQGRRAGRWRFCPGMRLRPDRLRTPSPVCVERTQAAAADSS